MSDRAERIRVLLDRYGYQAAESICNEWNYLKNWTDQFMYTVDMIRGCKGAAFVMSRISEAQRAPIDMLMYYDTRPGVLCGVFDYYTYKPQKAYYPLYCMEMIFTVAVPRCGVRRRLKTFIRCVALMRTGGLLQSLPIFRMTMPTADVTLHVDFAKEAEYEIYAVDREHNGERIRTTRDLTVTLPVHSCILIKEI